MSSKGTYPGYSAAVEFLAANGVSTKGQTPAYVKRLYGAYQKYAPYGVEPRLTQLRGHGRIEKIAAHKGTSIDRNGKERGFSVPDQYRTGSFEHPFIMADVVDLYRKATNPRNKKAGYSGPLNGSFTGIVRYRNPKTGNVEVMEKTLPFIADSDHFSTSIADYNNNPVQFAKAVSGYDWIEVYSVNLTAH